ncbi:uncharacterized protein BP01DRAFT_387643 [Aspergillus saccharolyticus JOP 1030-1]|uniref:Arylsulfotransferase n=1 Tax=Aspergillus saccharolyticus JOP 1030-1 TaxID=1450539 RepID=A0A318ZXB8_9EURO|nr:hypothetical protein BP01DRAFT_387643 [Aspergillus saccharolyticus JOP 1030-1]PYH40112.1 hypothetical protein BP01DRAFT_387643 [Aspergillus saccharolyticus JOP 1030-1]
MTFPHSLLLVEILAIIIGLVGAQSSAFTASDDSDLWQYRTLPQHRIPKWNITHYHRDATAPGYWFVAPYWVTVGEPYTTRWMPYQVGPYIYDQDGELVWTGAEYTDNQNAFDLRVVTNVPGRPQLSLMVQTGLGVDLEHANGTVLDYQYRELASTPVYDKHEFYVYAPHKALAIHQWPKVVDLAEIGLPGVSREIKFQGFRDVDYKTGHVFFEWNSEGRIPLHETFVDITVGTPLNGQDYIHCNAIEKTKHGDYLMSCRHSSTIYLISGQDGAILWRLGGKGNNFQKDFDFSWQHDARIILHTEGRLVISFLDNAADELTNDKPVSSAMIVELDLVKYQAKLLNQYFRPDGNLTRRRGSTQLLPNNNVFVSWSDYGYISEFDHDGRLLTAARFASDRFGNYRAYKFPWSAQPAEPPVVVAAVVGINGSELVTELYASWNGATEVKFWRFWARAAADADKVPIGIVPQTGFETSFIARGYMDWVSAEALDADQHSLGISGVVRSSPPSYWAPGADRPQPDDPQLLLFPPPPEKPSWSPSSIVVVLAAGLGLSTLCWLLLALFSGVRRVRHRVLAGYTKVHSID